MRVLLLILFVASIASCSRDAATYADLNTRDVTLRGGQVIQAETVTSTLQLARGLMFRTSLAPDHGMLFVHQRPGYYSYFMFQHEIPLDIVWIDVGPIVVEMFEHAPPCVPDASACPQYGGPKEAHV